MANARARVSSLFMSITFLKIKYREVVRCIHPAPEGKKLDRFVKRSMDMRKEAGNTGAPKAIDSASQNL